MSIYIDQYNNINRYYLEIEKYLPQLTYNPYIDEVKEDIYNKKISLLKEGVHTQYINYIDKYDIGTSVDYMSYKLCL